MQHVFQVNNLNKQSMQHTYTIIIRLKATEP